MVNNKGYIQTLEAILALMIIYLAISSILIGTQPKEKATVPNEIKLTQESLLKSVQESNIYRSCALAKDVDCINSMVYSTIGNKYGFNVTLCTKDYCMNPTTPLDKEVYARSVIIASNITNYSTTSVNLFLWNLI